MFPNPASHELYISLTAPDQKEATISINDLFGRAIYQQNINLTEGFKITYINTSNFSIGTYIANIRYGNSFSENIKVVISNNN